MVIDCSYKGECQMMGCINNNDCFIRELFEDRYLAEKELYRKEQECDMWKNLTIDNGAVALKYQQQLDQLKADNDLLRKTHKTEQDRRRAYENALAEIKEICNSVWGNGLDEEVDKFDLILQKISECEGNNDLEN